MQPQEYRNLALSSVGTHDLPPTAGYLSGAHNELRHQLGLMDDSFEEMDAQDIAWQSHVLNTAREHGVSVLVAQGNAPVFVLFSIRARLILDAGVADHVDEVGAGQS